MLLDLREKVRNSKPLKYSIITLISIPFVLVGIGSYFSGGTATPVAEVNGVPIDQLQLDRAYQQQRQQLASIFGGQLPEAFANETALRQQAMQQLVTQQVLESEVADQKFAVSDATLGRAIRALPNFQVNGQFNADAYQSQLLQSGMTIPVFEQSLRDDTALNQFRAGISDTAFTLPQEADRLAALGSQTRTVEAVKYNLAQTMEGIEVSEEDTAAYFEENQANYQFPERAKAQYIELDSSAVASGFEVTDEQAQAFYDDNRGRYVLPEQREASHILLESGNGDEDEQIETLNELKARVEAGESFADLAEEYSDDIGSAASGGSLGVITPGSMDPAFEEAVFALANVGDVSDPVVTDFGVHLISLDSVTPESGEPFEAVKDDIIATMQQDEADREYFELRDQLSELAFDNSGSLDPAADATGLELKTSDWLDRDTDAGPVLSSPAVLQALFSPDVLDDENNSDLITVGERHVIVLRVAEYEDERPKALDDVRDEVVDALKTERAKEQISTLLDTAVDQFAQGASAADIASESDLAEAISQETLDRQSTVFDSAVLARIFALPHPADGEIVTDRATLATGDEIALRLDAVQIPEPAAEVAANAATGADDAASTASDIDVDLESQTASTAETPVESPVTESEAVPAGVLAAGANPQLGDTEFQALIDSLRSKADVTIRDTSGAAPAAY